MTEPFMLEPDDLERDPPARRRPERLVSTGLAPTAALPSKVHSQPACYAPCVTCGALVLTGETPGGVLVSLDTQIATYVVLWLPETPRPVLQVSRGYPVHRCGG